MQPICSRFLKKPVDAKKEYHHPLILGQCQACGLVQLVNPFPLARILPLYDWVVRYAEPEEHLDKLAERIARLPGLEDNANDEKNAKDAKICGISFKDDSLLQRLKNMGFSNAWRLDMEKELGIKTAPAGVESVQDRFTLEKAEELASKHGKQDIIIARHILEHAYDVIGFLKALGELVKPGGYVVLEVPGCNQALEQLDYTTIWEEHTAYFTEQTFKHSITAASFFIKHFEEVPYPLESSLIAIAQLQEKKDEPEQKDKAKTIAMDKKILNKEIERAEDFAKGFSKRKEEWRDYLSRTNRIALFGAGHLACGFINFFKLKEFVDLVIDDNPNKKGWFMPGSALPILGSEALLGKKVELCLLSLNPRNEEKVVLKNQEFINQGGVFLSIFPSSKYALKL
jgi:SAM-dependent methyltransferase